MNNEKLKKRLSTILNAFSAISLDLVDFYALEDIVENEHYDIAEIYISSSPTINKEDKKALIYIFNHALSDYSNLAAAA